MNSINKIIVSIVATLVFGGLLFLTPLKDSSPSSSPWTLIVTVLAIASLVCFVVFLVKRLMGKK